MREDILALLRAIAQTSAGERAVALTHSALRLRSCYRTPVHPREIQRKEPIGTTPSVSALDLPNVAIRRTEQGMQRTCQRLPVWSGSWARKQAAASLAQDRSRRRADWWRFLACMNRPARRVNAMRHRVVALLSCRVWRDMKGAHYRDSDAR